MPFLVSFHEILFPEMCNHIWYWIFEIALGQNVQIVIFIEQMFTSFYLFFFFFALNVHFSHLHAMNWKLKKKSEKNKSLKWHFPTISVYLNCVEPMQKTHKSNSNVVTSVRRFIVELAIDLMLIDQMINFQAWNMLKSFKYNWIFLLTTTQDPSMHAWFVESSIWLELRRKMCNDHNPVSTSKSCGYLIEYINDLVIECAIQMKYYYWMPSILISLCSRIKKKVQNYQ